MPITSAGIRKVIDNLKKAVVMDGQLDMGCVSVNTLGHVCGTTHCHGGWYAVVACDLTMGLCYTDGSEQMNTDLGFTEPVLGMIHYYRQAGFPMTFGLTQIEKNKVFELYKKGDHVINWAKSNPHLWGNRYGEGMFSSEVAFASEEKPNGAATLQDIVDHWEGVYERVVADEEKDRKDITKELAVLPPDEVVDHTIIKQHETI